MSFRSLVLCLGLAVALSACAQTSRFLPAVDSGSTAREAAEQSALSARLRGALPDRLRQLGNDERVDDAARLTRVRPVAERLFAAATPFCRTPTAHLVIDGGGSACAYPVLLAEQAGLNAHADARRITITRAMVDLTADDDQLALVLGHELAHVLLGHTHRAANDRLAVAFGASSVKDDERQADYIGLYLAARAGYDPGRAAGLWRRMGAVQPEIIAGGPGHPGTAERYVALREAATEIEAKRRAGLPLLPQ